MFGEKVFSNAALQSFPIQFKNTPRPVASGDVLHPVSWDMLLERTAEGDIESLRPSANRKEGCQCSEPPIVACRAASKSE